MKTVLTTLISGIFICLITSIGLDSKIDIYDQPTGFLNEYNEFDINQNDKITDEKL